MSASGSPHGYAVSRQLECEPGLIVREVVDPRGGPEIARLFRKVDVGIELNQEAEIVSLMGSVTTDSQGRGNVHGHGTIAIHK